MKYELKNLICTLLDIDTILSESFKSVEISDIIIFNQTWPSTSLGFGGVGGQAMTSAPTTVLDCFVRRNADSEVERVWVVFFGRGLAYVVQNPTEKFKQDLATHNMASVAEAHKLY